MVTAPGRLRQQGEATLTWPSPLSRRLAGTVGERGGDLTARRRNRVRRHAAGEHVGVRTASLVPAATEGFWVAKLLSTGVGEALSDFLTRRFDPVVVVPLAAVLLGVLLLVQLSRRTLAPLLYWSVVLAVGVVGTMIADVAHVAFGVPYAVSAAVFAVVLAGVFVAWRRVEGTLDVHAITTRRRQAFLWAAVLSTFALGTAVGDLVADDLGLGYAGATLLAAAALAVPGVLWAGFRRWDVALFWIAYVLTRPFGASVADALSADPGRGGAGFGPGPVAAVGLALFVVVVGGMVLRPQPPRPATA